MILVKTTAAHFNAYGATYAKAVGDHYALPAAEVAVLVDAGLVEVLGEDPADEMPAASDGEAIDAGE